MHPRVSINGLGDLPRAKKGNRPPANAVLSAEPLHVEYFNDAAVFVTQAVSLRPRSADAGPRFVCVSIAIIWILASAYITNMPTALLPHVSDVVASSAEKQVVWSNADRVVALMADVHSIGNFSEMELPGSLVSPQLAALIAPVNGAISESVGWPVPHPAAIGLGDSFPEAIGKWADLVLSHVHQCGPTMNMSIVDLT